MNKSNFVAESTYLPVLDSLRAFAALSVVLYHFVCTTIGFIQNELALNIFSEGRAGVQTFFVISGFVIPWSMQAAGFNFKSIFTFFLKRLARLEPPYIFSMFLAISVYFLRAQILGRSNTQPMPSIEQVLLHFGYLIPWFEGYTWLNQVYWTLSVEFQYYVFIALLFIPLQKAVLGTRLFIYAALSLLSFIGTSDFLPHWFPVFLLGIILFLYKSNNVNRIEFYSVLSVLCCFIYLKCGMFCMLFSIIPVFAINSYPQLKVKFLHEVGKFSYSLYLIHPLIGGSLINVLSHNCTQPYQKILLIFGGLFISLLASWIMFRMVERPAKKLSASLRYN